MVFIENGGKQQATNGINGVTIEEGLEKLKFEETELVEGQEKAQGQLVKDNRKCRPFWRKWCHHGCPFWCRKYFWEGQLKSGATDEGFEETIETGGPFENLSESKRKLIGWLLPAIIFHTGFWAIMISKNMLGIFVDKYPMTITMLFGGTIAGMTSEAGGSVAFPIMTLVLNEPPYLARDLSMMLQSCGMSCATFAIFFMNVHIERHALVFCLMGSSAGVIFGLEFIDPILSPAVKKMGFVSIWFSFAFALFLLNRNYRRRTFNNIPDMNWWKRCVLFVVGFAGGICTSFSGSGADICSFSFLTLLFRVSEKVATPTSVVLMAMTSCVGWFWRGMITGGITQDGWEYLLAVLPCVTMMAPFGALIGTHFHRLVLASFVYITDTVALIGGYAIVPQTPKLLGMSMGIVGGGFTFFFILCKLGEMMLNKYEDSHGYKSSKNDLEAIENSHGYKSSKSDLEVIENTDKKV